MTTALTNGQITALRAAVLATPAALAFLTAKDVAGLQAWCNTATATRGWLVSASSSTSEEAPSYTAYDTLAQGKRDSWVVFLRADRDFSKAKIRNWVVDIWGPAIVSSNAETVLLAGSELATNAQVALGGTSRTTGTVTALDRAYTGQVDEMETKRLIFKDDGTTWGP